VPCKSGCASGVRGRAEFAAVFFTWPDMGRAVREINASAIAAALVPENNRFRIAYTSSIIC
jgi:hypothetical protein